MQLSESDIKYLIKDIKRCEKYVNETKQFSFRPAMRSEAAKLLINLAGYRFDNEKLDAYKLTQEEKREYFNASTTDSTSK